MVTRFVSLSVAAILGICSGQRAHAVLGEHIAAPARARVAVASYTMTERVNDSTVAIREYADVTGVVFAVAWEGPARPDLHALLGRYYEGFAAAVAGRAAGSGAGRNDLNVTTAQLLVQMGAHLRIHRGRVVLSNLLPAGVPLAEIQ